MNKDQREIARRLCILRHADESGHVAKTCRYFGISRSSLYRSRRAYAKYGDSGLINRPLIPKWHANRTPVEIEEKGLHLRRKYHLGPMRIVWYLARYHDIKISDATVSRMLKRNGVNRLPRGTRLRKVHTKPSNKQALRARKLLSRPTAGVTSDMTSSGLVSCIGRYPVPERYKAAWLAKNADLSGGHKRRLSQSPSADRCQPSCTIEGNNSCRIAF